jgi:rhodanese-related sulfurtransferase
MQQLSVSALQAWFDDAARPNPRVIDVREPWEIAIAPFAGATEIPMQQIPARIEELESDAPTVVLCHHGGRSMQVAVFLAHHGFTELYNLAGGIDAWSREVDASVARY